MKYSKPPLTIIPDINKYPDWHKPFSIDNLKVFSIIAILKYLLNIVAPNSSWFTRFESLFEKYGQVDALAMGFPANWKEHKILK